MLRPGQPCVVADPDPPHSLLTLDAQGAQTSLINRDWAVVEDEMQTASHQRYQLWVTLVSS